MHRDSAAFKGSDEGLVVCEHGHFSLSRGKSHRGGLAVVEIFVNFCNYAFHRLLANSQSLFCFNGIYRAFNIEGVLRLVVMLAVEDLAERAHRISHGHIDARYAREYLSNMNWL